MRKYIYFGKLHRNISYKGSSFPVAPGCVICCHPGFLDHFLPSKEFKETASSAKAKYTFKNTKSVFAQDPTGGLPMRSSSAPAPKDTHQPSPATVADQEYDKLYELREEAKLEESTNPEVKKKAEVKKADKVKTPADEEKAPKDPATKSSADLPVAKKPGKKKAKKETKKEEPKEKPKKKAAPKPKPTGPAVDQPTKTALRKMRKDDLLKVVGIVTKAGAPRHPEMMDKLKELTDDTHKGPIFDLVWKYYDMDEAE